MIATMTGIGSMRGCHIADTAISGVWTGNSNTTRTSIAGSVSQAHEPGTRATRSD